MRFTVIATLVACLAIVGIVEAQEPATEVGGDSALNVVDIPSNYLVSPLDTMRLSLFLADELQFLVETRVPADGRISVPHIGSFSIAGMTLDEARQHLYVLYDRDYYVNPHLDLQILAYHPKTVTVMGQVNKQGQVTFPAEQPLYLMEAIAQAGGWQDNDLADKKNVVITRNNADGETDEIEVDARELGAREYPLQDGDTIMVPRRVW